ncbi:MAG TPA: hypothetical protein VIL10_01250, partial [Marmoricola sp.]
MAWDGWFSYAGNEIINAARTECYATGANLGWFIPVFKNDSLGPVLGDSYISPLVDEAPWSDPDFPESYGFYGVYPLEVTGIDDSSRSSTVTESIRDGGNPGRLRHGTKTMVFNTVLIGEDDAAVSYGLRWLKQALLSGPCGGASTQDCSGDDLCFLDSEPHVDVTGVQVTVVDGLLAPPLDIDDGTPSTGGTGPDYDGGIANDDGVITTDVDGGTPTSEGTSTPGVVIVTDNSPEDCLPPLLRSLHKVVFNAGPTVTAKRTTSDGGAVWTVTFTAVAGEPWQYGAEVGVIEGFLDPAVTVPWVGGVVPDGGFLDLDGSIFDETACAEPVFSPIQDPLCPALIPPPLPPSVPLGCYDPPKNWRRRQITIPNTYIPLWGEVVPKFAIHARDTDVRNMRLRFYADVDGDGDISDDPCAFCGDIVVSYVPQGSSLIFDTSERQVYVLDASQRRRRADAVVFATDGTPFEWPVLTCG